MTFLKTYLISMLSFGILDFIWLGLIMKDFNMRHLQEIGRIENGQFKINFAAAIAVYLLMSLATTVFVKDKIIGLDSYLHVFGVGALLGLIIYGVYDFTNLAILKNYPTSFAFADVIWGTFLFGTVSVILKLSSNVIR